MAIYVPLVMVRRIEVFAPTHIFADIMIMITIIVVSVYAGLEVKDNDGFTTTGVQFINPTLWPDAIGFSVYAFEGIGVILPIMEVTERKDIYFKLLVTTVCFIALVYIFFAEFWLFAFGPSNLTKPLITENLPP
jgi:solute carrier family 36 (proton-coupled amino acid transporter)